MTPQAFTYRLEAPGDVPAIDAIHRDAFGPGRFARAAFRLREGVPHDPQLSFVALAGGKLIATVRLTPIRIGGRPAILLGPLAVAPAFKGQGAGKQLVRISVEAARRAGHRAVMLVGDLPYYGPLGFAQVPRHSITLPGPVDPDRVLVAALDPDALDGLAGRAEAVVPAGDAPGPQAPAAAEP